MISFGRQQDEPIDRASTHRQHELAFSNVIIGRGCHEKQRISGECGSLDRARNGRLDWLGNILDYERDARGLPLPKTRGACIAPKPELFDRRLHGIAPGEAESLMDRTDARRAAYYNYYSSGTWGMAETYDLCIDSSVLGIDGTTGFVLEFVERKLGVKP